MSSLALTGAGPESPGAGGGGPFDPTSIAGLQAWYKADAGTSTTTDGVGISQWNDVSGNARHAVQATGANQPKYKTAVQNGLPGVLFDGVDDLLDAAGLTLAQPDTLIVVAKASSAGGGSFVDGITNRQVGYIGSTGGSARWQMYAGTEQFGSLAPDTVAAHVFSLLFNGASSTLRVDGTDRSLSGNPGAGALTGLRIGATTTASGQWPGHIFEVLAYSGGLSVANQQYLEAGLKARWATP